MNDFIKPALAYPFEERRLAKGSWIAEQKWDGHRMLVRVGGGEVNSVECWSRALKPMENVPRHVRETIRLLPPGVYDGELVQAGDGGKSYGVSSARGGGGTGAASETLVYVVFDVLERGGVDRCSLPYSARRHDLTEMLAGLEPRVVENSYIVQSRVLDNGPPLVGGLEAVLLLADSVWERGGEGLILKEVNGLYRPGKRMQTWMKVKRLGSVVVTLVGFVPGLMGSRSVAWCQDDEGRRVDVKWKSHAWLEEMLANGEKHIGRKVRIEFTERTEGGGYREPRWDRWEDE